MRPTRPYHTVTARYRLPGGLRSLDFFMDRILELSDSLDLRKSNEQSCHPRGCGDPSVERMDSLFPLGRELGAERQGNDKWEFSVLVVCEKDDFVAIPFAAMGMRVTSIHASDAGMQRARAQAQEVGVDAVFLVQTPEQVPDKAFDAVVFSDGFFETENASGRVATLVQKLKPQGRIFVEVGRQTKNGTFASLKSGLVKLRSNGWRAVDARSSGMILGRLTRKFGRQLFNRRPNLFHALDAFDGWLADYLPRAWADGWMLELMTFGTEPLVIQLVPTLAMGGAERIALQLSQHLQGLEFQTLLATNVSGGPLQALAANMGVRHLVLDRKTQGGRWGVFWRQCRLFKDLKPDLLHTHLFAADFWGRLAAKLAGVRHIVTTEHNVRTDHGRVAQLALRLMNGVSDRYVAVSKDVAAHVARDYGVALSRLSTIYNGIDLSRIRHRSNRAFHDLPHMIFVGRLEPQKNPDVLLHALGKVQRPWRLTMYGAGYMEPMLHRLAEELGIAPRVSWEVRDDMSEVYADADLMVFPSQYEGLGLAAIEAAVAGVPMVMSRLAPLEELFSDSDVFFVQPGNAEELSQAILNVLTDPSQAIERGSRTAARDWSAFSLERMTAAYAELYRSLLTKSGL